jgi:hypothetical protein
VEQWQLVGLITRRSQVQILPPLPKNEYLKPVLKKTGFFFLHVTIMFVDLRFYELMLLNAGSGQDKAHQD